MGIHIRNLLTPNYQTDYTFYRWMMWLFREIALEVGGWTEVSVTADPAWESSSNVLLTVTDAVVSPDSRRITSATGGFSALSGGLYVTMKASIDNNKGIYSCGVVDDNTLSVGYDTLPANGWTAESGITARIHNCGTGLLLPTTEIRIYAGVPSGTNQCLFLKENTTSVNACDIRCYPKGDGTMTSTENIDVNYQTYRARVHAYIDNKSLLIWFTTNKDAAVVICFGELTDVASADAYPGFSSAAEDTITNFKYLVGYLWSSQVTQGLPVLNMLSHTDGQIVGYPTYLRSRTGYDSNYEYYYDGYINYNEHPERIRLQRNKTKAQKMWICMEDTASGGYIRGAHPCLRSGNSLLMPMAGISPNWLHMYDGTMFPRDGLKDNRFLYIRA